MMVSSIIIAIIGGPLLFILAFGIYYVISNYIAKYLTIFLNYRGKIPWIYYLVIFPGVVAHELAHYLACLITFTKVQRVELFHPREETLGLVVHEDPDDAYKTIIISTAPLFFNFILIIALIQWLLPGVSFFPLVFDLTEMIFSLRFLLFIYLAISLIAASAPSSADLANVFNALYEKPLYLLHLVLTLLLFYLIFTLEYFQLGTSDINSLVIAAIITGAFFFIFWLLSIGKNFFIVGIVIGIVGGIIISLLVPDISRIAIGLSFLVTGIIMNILGLPVKKR